MPRAIACRVVSLPATISSANMLSRSRVGEPAAVDLGAGDQGEHVLARARAPVGVVGPADRAQLLGPRGAERLVAVLLALSLDRPARRRNSGSVSTSSRSPSAISCGRSSSGRPSTCASTRIGIGAASSWTRSNSLADGHARRADAESGCAATPRSGRRCPGVKLVGDQPPVAAMLGRVELEEVAPGGEHVLGQVLDRRRRRRPPRRTSSASRRTACTSSYLVSTQKPRPPSGSRWKYTGASRCRRSKTSHGSWSANRS